MNKTMNDNLSPYALVMQYILNASTDELTNAMLWHYENNRSALLPVATLVIESMIAMAND